MFAACGITGFVLLDLSFAEGQGGAIVARARPHDCERRRHTKRLIGCDQRRCRLPDQAPARFSAAGNSRLARPSAAAAVHRAVPAHASEDQRRPRGAAAGAHVQRQREPLVSVCPGNDVFFADQRVDLYVHQLRGGRSYNRVLRIYLQPLRSLSAYMPPFRTVLGFQACHLDNEFYDRFYRAGPGRFPKRNAVTWTGGTSRTRMGPNKSISASSPKQACARAGVACFRQPFGLTMQGKKNSRRP